MSLDAHANEIAGQILGRLSGDIERHVRSLVADLLRAAADAQVAVADEVRRTAQADAEARVADAVAAARAEVERITAQLAEARDRADRADQAIAAERKSRALERETMLAGMERLLAAIERLDRATTLIDVLDATAEAAAAEAPRVLVLVRKPDQLRVWKVSGIDRSDGLPTSVSPDAAGPLREALERAVTVEVDAGRDEGALGLLGPRPARVGLAVPVVVDGTAVAVIYADDGAGEPQVPASWPESVQIVARHAGRCLEAITARQVLRPSSQAGVARSAARVGTEEASEGAQRYARLLLSELKLYHEPEIREGRRQRDLRTRLSAQLSRARRLYEERIGPQVADRDRLFDEEVVRTLADGDPSLLGAPAPGSGA